MVYFNVFSLIDNNIYKMIIQLKSNTLTNIMKVITFFASTKLIISLGVIIFIIYLIKKNKKILITDILLIITTIINLLLKTIFKRPRPNPSNWLVTESYYSFPSGHSMMALTFYGLLIYYLFKSNLNKTLKIILNTFLSLLIICIGISRIYLGVHYFSDICGGYLWSSLILAYAINIIKKEN